jgi:hypothetical protein
VARRVLEYSDETAQRDQALVEDAKLQDYVLNSQHPIGKHHAVLFERLLGIGRDNAEILPQALLEAAAEQDVSGETTTPFGRKYEMQFPMEGPLGTKTVLSA